MLVNEHNQITFGFSGIPEIVKNFAIRKYEVLRSTSYLLTADTRCFIFTEQARIPSTLRRHEESGFKTVLSFTFP
jgi:hypothetical protein